MLQIAHLLTCSPLMEKTVLCSPPTSPPSHGHLRDRCAACCLTKDLHLLTRSLSLACCGAWMGWARWGVDISGEAASCAPITVFSMGGWARWWVGRPTT